jgi:hypothetical protein
MPNQPLARAMPPPPEAPSEADYQAFCAALSQSGRGRALLAEYARRNRNADTAALLAAIERLEAHLRADASAAQRLRDDLRMLLIAIRIVRPEIAAAEPAAAKAAKLAALLDLLERRIDAMAEAKPAEFAPADATLGGHVLPDESAEAPRAHLAVVPPSEQPELPIPSPASPPPPAIVRVPDAAMMPAVSFLDSVPAAPAVGKKTAAAPAAQPPPTDPLAAIMALSEDERLALFT